MAKVFIEETTLTNIGNAIRSKEGTTALIPVNDMATRIEAISGGGGGDITDEELTIKGNCSYRFSNNGWNWVIDKYGNRMTTDSITRCFHMFEYCDQLDEIPFTLNLDLSKNSDSYDFTYFLNGCSKLTTLPKLNVISPIPMPGSQYASLKINSMFFNCHNLKHIPEDYFDPILPEGYWDKYNSFTDLSGISDYAFGGCYSLRSISPKLLKFKDNNRKTPSSYNSVYYNLVHGCYALDELVGIPINTKTTLTSNCLGSLLDHFLRVKNITFETNEDGTPIVANWKNQTLDIATTYIGYSVSGYTPYLLNYNSGITKDKEVKDDATYQALKNDPDWYTLKIEYCRYNHDSAVNTINSLPDTSQNGVTNTIRFKGTAGANTDGGACNTLTSEEIAIAEAKGWTVTFA